MGDLHVLRPAVPGHPPVLRPPAVSHVSGWWLEMVALSTLVVGGGTAFWSYHEAGHLVSPWSVLLVPVVVVGGFGIVINVIADRRVRRSVRDISIRWPPG